MVDEKPQGRNYLELEGIPEEGCVPALAEIEYSPETPIETPNNLSQPEQEELPNVSEPPKSEEGEQNQEGTRELSPFEIPVPENGDDDVLFGDDVSCGVDSGVWESPSKIKNGIHVLPKLSVTIQKCLNKSF